MMGRAGSRLEGALWRPIKIKNCDRAWRLRYRKPLLRVEQLELALGRHVCAAEAVDLIWFN